MRFTRKIRFREKGFVSFSCKYDPAKITHYNNINGAASTCTINVDECSSVLVSAEYVPLVSILLAVACLCDDSYCLLTISVV